MLFSSMGSETSPLVPRQTRAGETRGFTRTTLDSGHGGGMSAENLRRRGFRDAERRPSDVPERKHSGSCSARSPSITQSSRRRKRPPAWRWPNALRSSLSWLRSGHARPCPRHLVAHARVHQPVHELALKGSEKRADRTSLFGRTIEVPVQTPAVVVRAHPPGTSSWRL